MVLKKAPGTARDEPILIRTSRKVLAVAMAVAKQREWSLSQLGDIALRKYLESTADVMGDIAGEKRAKHATK